MENKLNRFSTIIPLEAYAHEIYSHFNVCLKTKREIIIKRASIGLVDFEIDQINEKIKFIQKLKLDENSENDELKRFKDFVETEKSLESRKIYLSAVKNSLETESWKHY